MTPVRLERGNHDCPSNGRCLMEHVSVLAGESFGPFPRCTHPSLATLAALVNDRCSDEGRVELLARAPALTRASSLDPGVTWRLVELCGDVVLADAPDDRSATRRVRRSLRAQRRWRRILPPDRSARLPRWFAVAASLTAADELLAAFHAVLDVSGPPGSVSRDRTLVHLLDAALATVGGRTTVDEVVNA